MCACMGMLPVMPPVLEVGAEAPRGAEAEARIRAARAVDAPPLSGRTRVPLEDLGLPCAP